MRTIVRIEGRDLCYDLERVHYLSDLSEGSLFIVKHPETHELCRARIVMKFVKGIDVVEDIRGELPYRWYIWKGNLFDQVFLIKKQY